MRFKLPWAARNKNTSSTHEAAKWVVRQDRKLSGEESADLGERLANDHDFAKAFHKSGSAWDLLDSMPSEAVEELSLETGSRPILLRPAWRKFAIAAILLVGCASLWWFGFKQSSYTSDLYFTQTRSTLDPWTQRLPDGSVIRLNAGAKVEVKYTPGIRRVELLLGEAHFTVAKQPDRPFVVIANQIRVQAVGTVFNVRVYQDRVDVLVTEGTVKLAAEENSPSIPEKLSTGGSGSEVDNFVISGQRAEISSKFENEEIEVVLFDTGSSYLNEILAWQRSLLTLGGDSLEEIASSFEQKTGVKLVIADPNLGHLKIGGQFPSEDVKGFLRVLKSGYGIQWNERSDGTLVIGDSL